MPIRGGQAALLVEFASADVFYREVDDLVAGIALAAEWHDCISESEARAEGGRAKVGLMSASEADWRAVSSDQYLDAQERLEQLAEGERSANLDQGQRECNQWGSPTLQPVWKRT
ncbi:hypothetical protein ACVCIC_02105 [Burkholderia glumae]|uniref:hypothetical protein n=1 Tax=Burkholderia glumae TaxID=337 RepID=UPI0015713DF8|nr:hypothetical protein [Burkholderia glumae]MCM2485589.1 hypothetical protein [Burkholderia glumae]MCM2511539.1 hypothetical protein [Burkholderia glumae]MCM2541752.1 hypothetical protein [Burkholderia glumae]QKM57592.1 hypothetical protein CG017_05671 [Burkholderia glumae]QTP37160.1 hypothetical protein B7759_05802 [Burkholderia glumae]